MPAHARLLAASAVLTLAVTACGAATPASTGPSTPVRAGVNASLADTSDKVDAIASDECATASATTVYPNCARFIAEVGNAALAVAGGAPGHPGADRLTAAATDVGGAVSAFIRDGCVASPSQAPPVAATCGTDLTHIQDGLRTMRAALRTASSAPTG